MAKRSVVPLLLTYAVVCAPAFLTIGYREIHAKEERAVVAHSAFKRSIYKCMADLITERTDQSVQPYFDDPSSSKRDTPTVIIGRDKTLLLESRGLIGGIQGKSDQDQISDKKDSRFLHFSLRLEKALSASDKSIGKKISIVQIAGAYNVRTGFPIGKLSHASDAVHPKPGNAQADMRLSGSTKTATAEDSDLGFLARDVRRELNTCALRHATRTMLFLG